MTKTNGESSITASLLGPAVNPLTAAVKALQAIANEAQQAVNQLTGLPLLPIAPAVSAAAFAPAASVAEPIAGASVPNGRRASGARMNPGEVLHPGDSLHSANGNYQLAMQTDGNLVLYSGTCALWASETAGKPVAVCIMQGDGNLVLYNGGGQAVWSSKTFGKPGAHLVLQDDGNIVIVEPNGAPAWASNTVHTIGADTLIYRARLKRWTNVPFFGTKGNDVIMVKLPAGATLKSVYIGPIDANDLNPGLSSPIGTQVGSSYSGARLTNVVSGPGFAAISTHWWFNAFSDAEYSISVWVTGPTAYPVEDNGVITSANLDKQIAGQVDRWFEDNKDGLITAAAAVADLCITIATGGTGAAIGTAIVAVVAAGAKVALSPSK